MKDMLLNQGLIRFDAGVEDTPSVKRTMLRPLFDEVLRLRLVKLLEDEGRRSCTARGLCDVRPLHGAAWLPTAGGLEGAHAKAATYVLGNGGSHVRAQCPCRCSARPWRTVVWGSTLALPFR
jgi:hypothetical protein